MMRFIGFCAHIKHPYGIVQAHIFPYGWAVEFMWKNKSVGFLAFCLKKIKIQKIEFRICKWEH